MCGILFYLTSSNIRPNLKTLQFRGPDAFSQKESGEYTFVFSRLAIVGSGATNQWVDTATGIDTTGVQPLDGSNGNLVLANGEIYNYKELASGFPLKKFRSDIDLLTYYDINDWKSWLPRLNADIAGVIYNEKTKSYIAFRDPTGIKPLYIGYSQTGDIIGFASLKTALHGAVKIEEFPPGHVYISGNELKPYMTPVHTSHLIQDIQVAKEGIYEYLVASVRRRMLHSNVPVAFLCSGGIDSSILLSIGHMIWTQELGNDPNTLQVYTMEYDDPTCKATDSFYARLLCEELGVNHTVVKFTKEDISTHLENILEVLETDDYRSVRAAVPQYLLARYIRKNTPYRVILSGEGADELFMGYNYFYLCPTDTMDSVNESKRLIANLHRYDILRADRTISSWGLEIRVPFLDSRFIRFVNSISGKLRNTSIEKELLRTSFEQFAPLQATRILDRGKEKFSDGCGLSYIPALMRIMASKYIDVETNKSSHLLEKYEEQYVKEWYTQHFPSLTESNHEFRELPSWATNTNKEASLIQNTIVEETKAPTTFVSYSELLNQLNSMPYVSGQGDLVHSLGLEE